MDVSRRDWLKGTGQLGALAAVGTDLAPVVAQAQELRIEHAKALQLGPQCRAASANSLRIISTNFCKAGALLSFLQTAENWGLTRRSPTSLKTTPLGFVLSADSMTKESPIPPATRLSIVVGLLTSCTIFNVNPAV